jgi:hypothetical protein
MANIQRTAEAVWTGNLREGRCPVSNALRGGLEIELEATLM